MASSKRSYDSPDRPRKRTFGGPKPNNFSISSGSVVSKMEDPMTSEARFEVEEGIDPQLDDFLSQVYLPTVNSNGDRNPDEGKKSNEVTRAEKERTPNEEEREYEELGRISMLEKRLADSNNRANAFRKEHEELLRKKEEEIMRLKAENERLIESRSSIEAFRENEIKRLKQRVHDQGMANKNPKIKIDENPSFFQMTEFFTEFLDPQFVDYYSDIDPDSSDIDIDQQ